jgi:hypothetical protein
MASWISIISALAGLLAGGAVTYLTSRAQFRIEAEHAYDSTLRDLRLPHYQRLFHLTERIPREWWPSSIPSKAQLFAMREAFHDWYFSEAGGMFLSQAARKAYSLLQSEIQSAANRLPSDVALLATDDAVKVRQRASALRHQLSADLGVAQQPRQRWTAPQDVPPLS